MQAPWVTYFKPAGVPVDGLKGVTLKLEEVEAIRLKDIEDLHQEECARRMGISRGTFHQIVKSARRKLADAILNGKSIRVEGGNVAFPGARFRCQHDGYEWSLPPGPLPVAAPVTCPSCRGRDVLPVFPGAPPWQGRRGGHGHGWGGGHGTPGERQKMQPERLARRGRGQPQGGEP